MADVRELLPCPFCGVRLVQSVSLSRRRTNVFVHPELELGCFAEGVVISASSLRACAWNRRSSPGGEANG